MRKSWALKQREQTGFTIVELLIVIVVIGILAAITVAAYRGVQNSANDAAIKSDLRTFHNQISQYKALNDGEYPPSLNASMGIKFSRDSYGVDHQGRNAGYCVNAASGEYIMYANSKSGNYFKYTSAGGLTPATRSFGWAICSQIGLAETNPSSYGFANGAWSSWVN